MKKAKKLGLLPLIRNCERRGIVFRKLIALAILPANDIILAFNWILTNAALDIRRDFARLFRYYERLQRVTPQGFSVFGIVCKTNNAIEAYHRVQIRMGLHPLVWQFTGR